MAGLQREVGRYVAPQNQKQGLYRKVGGGANEINGGTYLAGKVAAGAASIGIGAYNLIAGGFYQLTGNDYAAEKLYAENDPHAFSKKLDSQYNANGFMSFMGSVAEGVGQSIPAMVLNLIPGAGTGLSIGTTLAGHIGLGVGDAYAKTGNLGAREYLYGAAVGTMESALELIGGKAGGWIGGSKLGSAAVNLGKGATKGISRAAASAGKLGVARTAGQVLKGGLGEFTEEVIEAWAEVGLQRALQIDPNASVTLGEALYAGAVGFVSGSALSGSAAVLNTPAMKHVGKRVMNAGEVDVTITAANEVASAFRSNGSQEAAALKTLKDNLALWELTADKQGGQAQMILGNIELSMNVVAAMAEAQGTVRQVTAHPERFLSYARTLFGDRVTVEELKDPDSRIVRFLAASNWATGEGDVLALRAKRSMFEHRIRAESEGTETVPLLGSEMWAGGDAMYRTQDGEYILVSGGKNGLYTVMKGPDLDNLHAFERGGTTALDQEAVAVALDAILRHQGERTALPAGAQAVAALPAAPIPMPGAQVQRAPIPLPGAQVQGAPISLPAPGGATRLSLEAYIGEYTDDEAASIQKNSRFSVAKTYQDVLDFMERAISSSDNGLLFVGKLNHEVVRKIQSATGFHLKGSSLVLSGDDIRHLFKQHGNTHSESLRGQRAVTVAEFHHVLRTVLDPDTVEHTTDSGGTVSFVFKKNIDGNVTAVTVLSKKKKALTLKSAWISQEGQHISQPHDVQAPRQTPKANRSMDTAPMDSIPQIEGDVKRNGRKRFSLEDVANDLPDAEGAMPKGEAQAPVGRPKEAPAAGAQQGATQQSAPQGDSPAKPQNKPRGTAQHVLSHEVTRTRERIIDEYGAEVQDRARRLLGKRVDGLSADRRIAIYEAILSGEQVSEDVLRATCYFLSKRPGLFLYFDRELNGRLEREDAAARETGAMVPYGTPQPKRIQGFHHVFSAGARLVVTSRGTKGIRRVLTHELFHDVAHTKAGQRLFAAALQAAEVKDLLSVAKNYGRYYAAAYQKWDIPTFEDFLAKGAYDTESRESVLKAVTAYEAVLEPVAGKGVITEEIAANVVGSRLGNERFMKMAKDTGAGGLILRGIRRMLTYLCGKQEARPLYLETVRLENLFLDAVGQQSGYDAGTRFELDGTPRIAPGMSDAQRYEVLKNRRITLSAVMDVDRVKHAERQAEVDLAHLGTVKGREKLKLIRKLATEFQVFREYKNRDVNITFEFSRNNFTESYQKQRRNYEAFAKMFSVFGAVIDNAVGIEIHNRNGAYKSDPTLENVYVLASAFVDGSEIVPIKLEIKEFRDKENALYVAIALESIKKDGITKVRDANGVAQTFPPPDISIADFFKNINPSDESFYKYIPRPFLDNNVAAGTPSGTHLSLSEDEHELHLRRPTAGQAQARVARASRAKAYRRMEADEVIGAMFSVNLFGERGDLLTMLGKDRRSIVDWLWNQMNKVNPDRFEETADLVADFMIRHIVVEEAMTVPEEQAQLEKSRIAAYVISGFKHRIHVTDDMRQALIKSFKKTMGNRLANSWHQEDGNGMSVEAAVAAVEVQMAAEGYPVTLTADSVQASFDHLVELYANALQDLEKVVKSRMEAVYNKEQLATYRAEIKRLLYGALETKGKDTKLRRLLTYYENRVSELSDKMREVTHNYDNAVRVQYGAATAVYLAREVGEMVTKRKYLSAAEVVTPEMETVGNLLAEIATPRKIKDQRAREVMALLAQWYTPHNIDGDSAGENGEAGDSSHYHPDIKEKMERIAAGDKNAQLTFEELRDLAQVLGAVKRVIETHGTVLLAGRREQAATLAAGETAMLGTYLAAGEGKGGDGLLSRMFHNAGHAIGKKLKNNFLYRVMTPAQVVQSLEWFDADGVLTKAYQDIQDGVAGSGSDYANMMRPVMDFLDTHKKYEKRLTKSYILYDGMEMTVGQALALYLTTKREQAEPGFAESGFRFMGKDGTVRSARARPAAEIRNEIGSALTAEDRAYIKILEGVFETARELKVRTDMEVFGFTNIESGFYFPIYRDQMEVARRVSDLRATIREMAVVGNKSFNKSTVKGAKNALFISDVTTVTDAHAMGVAQYANLYIPFSTFDRLWNKQVEDGKGGKTSIRRMVGDEIFNGRGKRDMADTFFRQLFADIQGVRTERRVGDDLYATIRTTYVSAALGFNLSSILKQLGSFPSAAVYLSPVDLARGLAMNRKTDRPEMWKYSKVANGRMFERGRFAGTESNTRLEDAVKWVRKLGEVSTAGVEGMDNWVVGRLWNACQQNIARTKGLALGTEQNKIEAGKLLDTVINNTQSTSTADTRSAAQRGGFFAQTITMFTSDAVKQVSYLFEGAARVYCALLRRKMGKGSDSEVKAAKRFLGRSVAAFAASTALVVAITQLIKWLLGREREEDESLAEDIAKDTFGQVLGILPLVGDAYDKLVNGYDVDSFVFENINGLADGVIALTGNLSKAAAGETVARQDILKPARNVVYQTCHFLGLPARNMANYITGVVKKVSPEAGYAWDSLFEKPSYEADIAKALERGDEELAQYILELSLRERMGKGEYDSEVAAELLRLTNGFEDPDDSVAPLKIPSTVNDTPVSGEQYKQMQRIYNRAGKAIAEMLREDAYLALTDEARADAINRTWRTYLNLAKAEVMGTEDGKRTAAVWVAPLLSGESNAILARIAGMEDTEVATRAEQVTAYLNSLDLTGDEQYLLLFAAGYRSKTVMKRVRAAMAASNISEADKKAFETQYSEEK